MADVIIVQNGVRGTTLGLDRIPDGLQLDEWQRLGLRLHAMVSGGRWCLGDWVVYGESRSDWGESYTQGFDPDRFDHHTVMNCRWVSSRIPLSRRREKLSWSHHEAVAGLESAQQDQLLRRAEEDHWNVMDLRKKVAELRDIGNGRTASGTSTHSGNGFGGGAESDSALSLSPLETAQRAYVALTPRQREEFREWLAARVEA